MLALGIEFLTGRYVATAYNDRRRSEWPPHPARVFSALVATHYDDPDRDPREREALRWLEQQAPPEIHGTDAHERDVVEVFVPVNDPTVVGDVWNEFDEVAAARVSLAEAADGKDQAKARKAVDKAEAKLATKIAKAIAPIEGAIPADARKLGASLLPDQRGKQARTFPSVVPEAPRVTLIWRSAEAAADVLAALDRLAARVARLGHSSSLVSMRIVEETQVREQLYRRPDPDGDEVLRGVDAGQFDRLGEDFVRHQGSEPRVMPAAAHTYARPSTPQGDVLASVFGDDWIVLAVTDRERFSMGRCVDIARAVRKALQACSPRQPVPEFISGHRSDGPPSERDHLAVVTLPFIGTQYADGDVRGIALVLPRAATREQRSDVLRAVDAWERSDKADRTRSTVRIPVLLPGGAALRVERQAEPEMWTLRPKSWCGPARTWATVTPIALDRHPGDLTSRDQAAQAKATVAARQTIIAACRRIGLPSPHVELHPAAPIAGARKARDFPSYPPVAGRTRRVLTHAVVTFDQPVVGPVLLGAGRYHGLGLLCPFDGESP